MAWDVEAVVGPAGWATTGELTSQVDRGTLRAWVAAGRLVRLRPGRLRDTGRRRAMAHPGSGCAVRPRRTGQPQHRAGAVELVPPPPGPIHVSVAGESSGRGTPGVALHRQADLHDARRRVHGLPVTSVERSVVDTWGRPGGLSRSAVRAAAITAVRQRRCRPADLAYELSRQPRLPERAELRELVRLLDQGCQSELEIWGCRHVLVGPGMPQFTQQHRVTVGGRRFLLDAAREDVLLAVEMDGAAYHGSPRQREDDIRRDALLATVGWQTLRFSYARLTRAPEGCRRDILATHAARRRLLGFHDVR